MATFQVVDEFVKNLSDKLIDMNSDTFKAVITNTAPTKAGSALLADLTEIASTGGYAAVTITTPTFTETAAGSGIWEFDCDAFAWTATGAAFATARYIAIYSDTSTGDCLIGFADLGSFTLAEDATLTVTPGSNGVLRVTVS
jgi:hypothetical protein